MASLSLGSYENTGAADDSREHRGRGSWQGEGMAKLVSYLTIYVLYAFKNKT